MTMANSSRDSTEDEAIPPLNVIPDYELSSEWLEDEPAEPSKPDADEPSTPDIGTPDKSLTPDIGTPDKSLTPDAGTPDIGTPDKSLTPDAGTPDIGTPDKSLTPDAGTPDIDTPDKSLTPDAGTPAKPREPVTKKPHAKLKKLAGTTGPPLIPFITLVIVALITVILFIAPNMAVTVPGISIELNRHAYSYPIGSLLSILLLTTFLRKDTQARETMLYADWSRLSGRRVATWLTSGSWVLGAIHLFLFLWSIE